MKSYSETFKDWIERLAKYTKEFDALNEKEETIEVIKEKRRLIDLMKELNEEIKTDTLQTKLEIKE